jgi:hypothetical protein
MTHRHHTLSRLRGWLLSALRLAEEMRRTPRDTAEVF